MRNATSLNIWQLLLTIAALKGTLNHSLRWWMGGTLKVTYWHSIAVISHKLDLLLLLIIWIRQVMRLHSHRIMLIFMIEIPHHLSWMRHMRINEASLMFIWMRRIRLTLNLGLMLIAIHRGNHWVLHYINLFSFLDHIWTNLGLCNIRCMKCLPTRYIVYLIMYHVINLFTSINAPINLFAGLYMWIMAVKVLLVGKLRQLSVTATTSKTTFSCLELLRNRRQDLISQEHLMVLLPLFF